MALLFDKRLQKDPSLLKGRGAIVYVPKSHFKKIFIILQLGFLFSLLGCSGLEKSEQDKLREKNAKGEYVYRNHDEVSYPVPTPRHRDREAYPWESAEKK